MRDFILFKTKESGSEHWLPRLRIASQHRIGRSVDAFHATALAAGGSSACCARRHVVRYAPLLINCSAENKESQHSTAQTAAAAYRHRAPPPPPGYEPKGHELGFTAGLLFRLRLRCLVGDKLFVDYSGQKGADRRSRDRYGT